MASSFSRTLRSLDQLRSSRLGLALTLVVLGAWCTWIRYGSIELYASTTQARWQLSHGERSRVFLARALLQRAELVVLDETFGALDPLTLQRCLEVARRRASALVVIAHP